MSLGGARGTWILWAVSSLATLSAACASDSGSDDGAVKLGIAGSSDQSGSGSGAGGAASSAGRGPRAGADARPASAGRSAGAAAGSSGSGAGGADAGAAGAGSGDAASAGGVAAGGGSAGTAAPGGRGSAANGGSGGVAASGGAGSAAGGGSGGSGDAGSAAGGGGAAAASGDSGSGGAASGGSGSGSGAGGAGSAGSDPPIPAEDLTFLSETDRSENGVTLSPDRLAGEWLGLGTWGVRSTRAITARQGVFYFEAYAPLDRFDLGVATAAAALDRPAGTSSEGFSVDTEGSYLVGGDQTSFPPNGNTTYGFIVDYRGDHPVVHAIGGSSKPGALVVSQTLDSISAPVFIHLSGQRRRAGPQVSINPGNDTINRPFTLDPVAALQAAGMTDVASALVLGWGASHQLRLDAAPTLNVAPASSTTLALGASLTLTATANDAEDGTLTDKIDWQVLSEGNGPERVHGSGGSFTFEPNAIGQHPIEVSISDAAGKRASSLLTLQVTGTLPQFTTVRLTPEDGLSGSGIALSSNGLQAHWSVDAKNGVRANQGLYGGFWYFEGHRLVAQANQAAGLVIGGVSLNPYHFDVAPPSCSVNTYGPGIYQDLIDHGQLALPDVEYYGFAVDYRGDSPTVYAIMDGKLQAMLELKDVTVPIYPMLYGNVTNLGAAYDMEINFGAARFHEDARAVLEAAGISSQGLRLCWGTSNASCVQQ